MSTLDYAVLVAYFAAMAGIGYLCMRRVKSKEDFFLGGRAFGRLLQTFAAFGAGTGANDPVSIGRTTYTSGLSGIWVVLLWLFVTPFYWIIGVWFRRMRHLTTGDWFVERYESRTLGAAYALFGLIYYMVYLSVAFSAVGKVCAYLMRSQAWGVSEEALASAVVAVVALVVVIYGVLGGLRAAYWTDLVQGLFIILLSVLLIPFGLRALVDHFGEPTRGLLDGFRLMHQQLPPEYFQIIESPRGGEFPLYYIVAITLLNLFGIVVQPHFIATGGGAARNENAARVGLVVGNFLKRLCTVGWSLTALIVLALYADSAELAADPDRVWGVAALEILGPLEAGLVGLMIACLLAALMSSADCYMLVSSALIVRNLYAQFRRDPPSEREYLFLGRTVSVVLIAGSVAISLSYLDVFEQLKMAWELTTIFAAPFWIGMFWRRATRAAAWGTVIISALAFFVVPKTLPLLWPELRGDPRFAATNVIETTTVRRRAAPADVKKRQAQILAWERRRGDTEASGDQKALGALGPRPVPLELGAAIEDTFTTGGQPLYWRGGLKPREGAEPRRQEISRRREGNTTVVEEELAGEILGRGDFNLDFYLYGLLGLDLARLSTPALETLRLPPRMLVPFVVMILLSLLTRRGTREVLDRFYVKMKTPTESDPGADALQLEISYNYPRRFDHKRLFPGTDFEFQKPSFTDVAGFVLSLLACFAIIALAVWVAGIGA